MRVSVRVRNPATALCWVHIAPTEVGKYRRRIVACLLGAFGKIDAAAIKARGRAGF